jgi:hypothetical protein
VRTRSSRCRTCRRPFGVDHIADPGEILVKEGVSKSPSGVGHEDVDGTPLGGRVKLIDAFLRSKIDVKRVDRTDTRLASQIRGGGFDFGFICSYQQIKAPTCTDAREF